VLVSLHRALCKPLEADEVPRGKEPACDLQPPGRLAAAPAAAAEVHVGWDGGVEAGSDGE
jgi:hypothetical protein